MKEVKPDKDQSLKRQIHEVIFEADTRAGKIFDVGLFIAIILSLIAVMLETVPGYRETHGQRIRIIEWIFTLLFTIEYLLRIYSVTKPWRYAKSFYGVIDLLSILPTYIGLFFAGSQALMVIRGVRLLRIFRVLKLSRYLFEAEMLGKALKASQRKITVFLLAVVTIVMIAGAVMYVVEGGENGFDSIPKSIYWAIVTLTTVGYGDISPGTTLGQFIASFIMILGYGILAVPTGIVTSEMKRIDSNDRHTNNACPHCSAEGHRGNAEFCYNCGGKLD
ncbi:MAG: ion transporter [Flavobacteriales bacterium]|nr:ion transporter [Flavobacteriales bacterium]